tara:strand:- start:409 stop:681 length:273 start_codon:yes stop_codon:yes gene_type:complete
MIGVDRYEGDYHFNTARPLAGTSGQYCGKNKGVLITVGKADTVEIFSYRANGTTFSVKIPLPTFSTEIYPFRVWGVSYDVANGSTAALLA